MLTRIHVNQHIIKNNNKKDLCNPPLVAKTYKNNKYGHQIVIHGPCKIVYRPKKPLNCGARCWIETNSPVEIITE